MSYSENPLKNQSTSILGDLKVGCCFENKDWYLLDAQKGVMTGAESGDKPRNLNLNPL